MWDISWLGQQKTVTEHTIAGFQAAILELW